MNAGTDAAPKVRRVFILLPLFIFLGLAAIFFTRLLSGEDISTVPSALIGQPAPETRLPPLAGVDLPGLNSSAFKGRVTLLNVWGSWCVPCRQEHPLLLELARDERFALAGLNYKDRPGKCAALPWRTWQSLRSHRRGRCGSRRHRLGRVWRAGNLPDRQGRQDCLQTCRPVHARIDPRRSDA